jgi:hypothetical protein
MLAGGAIAWLVALQLLLMNALTAARSAPQLSARQPERDRG